MSTMTSGLARPTGTPAPNKLERVAELMDRDIRWPVPRQAVRFIALEEDCRLTPYKCSAGVWTCGWGETEGVQPGVPWTQGYADERFRLALAEWAARMKPLITAPTTDNEFSAMLALAYNIGIGDPKRNIPGFWNSTVLRQHNAGNTSASSRAFSLWNKISVPKVVNGSRTMVKQESPGLTARRARESALYLQPSEDVAPSRMPQAVEAESPVTASPIARGGAVAAGAGALSVVKGITDMAAEAGTPAIAALGTAKTAVDGLGSVMQGLAAGIQSVLGVPPILLFGVGLAYTGYVVVKWRRRQRAEGWA